MHVVLYRIYAVEVLFLNLYLLLGLLFTVGLLYLFKV